MLALIEQMVQAFKHIIAMVPATAGMASHVAQMEQTMAAMKAEAATPPAPDPDNSADTLNAAEDHDLAVPPAPYDHADETH